MVNNDDDNIFVSFFEMKWLDIIQDYNIAFYTCNAINKPTHSDFSELKLKYNVTAVPKFFIINKDGEIITSKGRKEVQDKGIIAFRNWQQAALVYEAKLAQAHSNPDGGSGADAEGECAGDTLVTGKERTGE